MATTMRASREPAARRAQYLKSRKPRQCKQCESDLELGSKKQLCDTCRSTPNPRCKKCKKVKPLSRFSHDSSRPSGYFPWCMDCQAKGVRAGAWQNPEDELNGHVCPMDDTPIRGHRNRRFCSNSCKDRASTLRNKYNLSPAQYRELIANTGGKCPICGDTPTSWQVDHNHSTGKVTGVVCIGCNVGVLAYSNHSIEYVKSLLAYLSETPAERAGIDARVPPEYDQKSNIHKRWKHGR